MTKKHLFLTILLIVVSPWFWLFISQPSAYQPNQITWLNINDSFIINDINTIRGDLAKGGSGIAGRLYVNKFTRFGIEYLSRVAQGLDFNFLFFRGDLDPRRSLSSAGLLPLTFAIPLLVGLFALWQKKSRFLVLIAISLLPAGLVSENYDSISRLPYLLLISYLVASGFMRLFRRPGSLRLAYLILVIYDLSRLFHQFIFHQFT